MSWADDLLGFLGQGDNRFNTGSYSGSTQETADKKRMAAIGPENTHNNDVLSIKSNIATANANPVSSIATDYAGGAEMRAIDRQIAQAQATLAAQPKLLDYDPNAAWQKAQNSAAGSVNPVYTDYLNNFLERQKNALGQTTAEVGAGKAASDTTLGQTQEDIATNKTRTAEDTATALATNAANEGNWQTTEGSQNTAAEEAARTAAGDQGTMGRGASQLNEAKITRNQTSDQQTKAYKQERDTTNLLKTRTFADLDTKGNRAVQYNATEKANLDRSLADFIVNQGTDLTGFKSTNEQARLDKLASTTQSQYNTDLGSWLAEQGKSGARSQDLALSKTLYSR